MLTVLDMNRVTFAHHRGIVPPAPAKEGGEGYRAAICLLCQYEADGIRLHHVV